MKNWLEVGALYAAIFLPRLQPMTTTVQLKSNDIAIHVQKRHLRGPIDLSRYIDIINGKVGIYAEARRKWKRRFAKHKPTKGVLCPSLNKERQRIQNKNNK